MDLWENDEIQFARLLAEISQGDLLRDADRDELCEWMDVGRAELAELFTRAERAWERAKRQHLPHYAPDTDILPREDRP